MLSTGAKMLSCPENTVRSNRASIPHQSIDDMKPATQLSEIFDS